MDLVRVVTGHRTVDVVMKHYFKPKRDEIRAAFQKNMPTLLTGPEKLHEGPKDIEALLENATQENAWAIIQKLKAIK